MIKSEFSNLNEWKEKYPREYKIASKEGLLPEIYDLYNMKGKKPRNYWNEYRVIKEDKKFKKYSNWKETPSYKGAKKLNIIDKVSKHMIRNVNKKPSNYWNFNTIKRDMLLNKQYKGWVNSPSYHAAIVTGKPYLLYSIS